MKKLILILFFTINLFSNETFILPKDRNIFEKRLESIIDNSKKSIFISIYNFSSKKLSKKLLEANKRGVDIFIIFDSEKLRDSKKIYNELKKQGIKTKIIDSKKKMHIKSMLIDEKIALIGSANYTKDSFEENFELLYISGDDGLIQRLNEFRVNLE